MKSLQPIFACTQSPEPIKLNLTGDSKALIDHPCQLTASQCSKASRLADWLRPGDNLGQSDRPFTYCLALVTHKVVRRHTQQLNGATAE